MEERVGIGSEVRVLARRRCRVGRALRLLVLGLRQLLL